MKTTTVERLEMRDTAKNDPGYRWASCDVLNLLDDINFLLRRQHRDARFIEAQREDLKRANKRARLVLDLVGIREGETIIDDETAQAIAEGWLQERGFVAVDAHEQLNLRAEVERERDLRRAAAKTATDRHRDWCEAIRERDEARALANEFADTIASNRGEDHVPLAWDANDNGVIDNADELAAYAEQADHGRNEE